MCVSRISTVAGRCGNAAGLRRASGRRGMARPYGRAAPVPSADARCGLRETRSGLRPSPDDAAAGCCDRRGMTSQILVGIDETPAHEAVSLATALAVLAGSEVLLGAGYGHESGSFGGLGWPPREDADAWLKEAESRLAGQGLPWRSMLICGASAAEGLVTLAERESASMVVL